MNFLNYSQDYYRLRQFYFVAKAGSLSGAGRMMGLTHGTLSESMSILEHRLKTTLLVREGRGMKLTADGERLYEFTQKLIYDSETFLETFVEQGDEIHGEIKIITTPVVAETELTHHLLPFLEKYPKINVKITTSVDDFDVIDHDVAIRTFIPNREDIEQMYLHTHHLKLWACQEYLNKFGTPITAQDLEKHRLLSYKEERHNVYFKSNWTNWILHVENQKETLRRSFYQMTSYEGLHNAAIKGYGIVQLPREWIALKNSQLVEVLPNLKEKKADLFFIYKKASKNSKRINALYEFLLPCFQNKETYSL
jgi:DNA-binding transcriptional LysR family regulator